MSAAASASHAVSINATDWVIPFESNQGQLDAEVAFAARTFGGTLFVTKDGKLVHTLPAKRSGRNELQSTKRGAAAIEQSGWSIVETLDGAAILKSKGGQTATARVSRFVGNDASKWQRDGTTFQTIHVGEAWPGVMVDLTAHGNNVEKLFTVSPHADPKAIRVKVSGAEKLRVDSDGSLVMKTGNGDVAFTRPVAYQAVQGRRREVAVSYQLQLHNGYSFTLGEYDPDQPLVIDPLLQSTYLAGSGGDNGEAIAVDAAGNVYIAGSSTSANFPGVAGGAQPAYTASGDAFVAKLSGDLKTIIQATYLGGSSGEVAHAIVLDASGNVYVTGETSSANFPGVVGGAQPAYGGVMDVFVTKLSGDLKTLLQSTYLGGGDDDRASTIGIDSGGSVFVAGYTALVTGFTYKFPNIAGGAISSFATNTSQAGFVAKLSSDLKTLNQATLLGGSFDHASISALGIGATGNVYVTGVTYATDFPGAAGGAKPSAGAPSYSGYVTAFGNDLKTLQQSTYLSGDGYTLSKALVVESGGTVYVAGSTNAPDFPAVAGGAQATSNGGSSVYNAFVTRLNGDLKSFVQSTLFGGSSDQAAYALTLDSGGHVFIAGRTTSIDLPASAGGALNSPSSSLGASSHAGFAARFSGDLKTLVQSTYVELGNYQSTKAIAVDPSGNVFVGGGVDASLRGTTGGAQATRPAGNLGAAFVAKFTPNLTALVDGACGGANGGSFVVAPATNLCVAGNATSVTQTATQWTWACSGISGGTSATCNANVQCSMDLDGNGSVNATSDGLMLPRILQGASGVGITNGALGLPILTRTTGAAISSYMQPAITAKLLDVDGNGAVEVADGLMILRMLQGVTGDAVIANSGATGVPTRITGAAVRGYFATTCNVVLP